MAGELGLASVAPQRGWEALKAIGWSIPPRPKNPKSATPKRRPRSKKARGRPRRGGSEATRQASRGLRHGRAPHRLEAGHAASASVRSRLAIIASTGSTSRPSHRRPRAKPSGIFPTACRSHCSRRCWRRSRAKPKRASDASSCSCSIMRDGEASQSHVNGTSKPPKAF